MKYKSLTWKIVGAVLVLIIVSCSLTIDTVDQPASVNGGDDLHVTVNAKIHADVPQTSSFMVAVLVPKVWHAAQNTHITFVSELTTGVQPMTVIPAGTPAPQGNGLDWPSLLAAKVGNGGNLLPDWEWVAFYSNSSYDVAGGADGTITISITTKTSTDNLMFKPAYCIANSSDGLSSSDRYSVFKTTNSCFQVNGVGDLIDFCNPQLSTIDPRTSLDNDIVTVTFDGGIDSTALNNASQVYLCIAGITTTGDSLSVCSQTDATRMRALGLNKWQLDLWPRKLFNLTDNQHLSGLKYFFTDANGNHKVGYGGGSDPFTYTFKCQ